MVASRRCCVPTLALTFGLSLFGTTAALAEEGLREAGLCKQDCTQFSDFVGDVARRDNMPTSLIETRSASETRSAPRPPAQSAPFLRTAQPPAPASALQPMAQQAVAAPAPTPAPPFTLPPFLFPREPGPFAPSSGFEPTAPSAQSAASEDTRPAAKATRAARSAERRARIRAARSSAKEPRSQAAESQPVDHEPHLSLGLVTDLAGTIAQDIVRSAPSPMSVTQSGKAGTIDELLGRKSADLAVTSTVALKRALAAHDAADQLAVVAKLFTEEVHVVAGPGVETIKDVDGKRVAVGAAGSAAELAAHDVLTALGIESTEVNASPEEALAKLRSGEVAAAILVAGKPFAALADVEDAELRLIAVPFAAALEADYYPATLAAETYPNLLPKGERVDTIAVGTVLVAREPADKDRDRVATFVESFFGAVEGLAASGHPKWREVNLAARIPELPRSEPAQQWLLARQAAPERPRPISSARAEASAKR